MDANIIDFGWTTRQNFITKMKRNIVNPMMTNLKILD